MKNNNGKIRTILRKRRLALKSSALWALMLMLILIRGNDFVFAQPVQNISQMRIITPDGAELNVGDLVQDDSPMMWIFVKPGDAYSESYLDEFKDNWLKIYREQYGVRTFFFSQLKPTEIRSRKLLNDWDWLNKKVPSPVYFGFSGSDLLRAFEISGYPATIIFNGKKDIVLNYSGTMKKQQIDKIIFAFPSIKYKENIPAKAKSVNTETILNLFGKKSSDAIVALGAPEKITWNWLAGNYFTYPGFSLKLKAGQVEEIKFDGNYGNYLFGKVSMGSHKNGAERILGEGVVLKTFTGTQGVNGYKEIGNFNNEVVYKYLYNQLDRLDENNLIELTVSGKEGAQALLAAEEKANREKYSVRNLTNLIGRSRYDVTSRLGDPQMIGDKGAENENLLYLSGGFGIILNNPGDVVTALTFFPQTQQTKGYPHQLPFGIKWDMTESEARKKFGEPDNTALQAGMKILIFNNRGMLLVYNPNSDQLWRVQFFANAKEMLLQEN